MIQYNTTNVSFLKVAKLLKEKGIKNNTFFLKLYDESLLNVNPHDPNITDDQKNRIIIEVTRNPWYFLRECVRIASAGTTPYELHLGNLAFNWAVLNNFNTYMVLPRQRGKTTAAAALICWITYFAGKNTETMLYAQTDKNLTNNMSRVRNIRENLPEYLRLNNGRKDRDGSEMITFSALGNKILRQAPKRSEEGADSVGRGFSTSCAFYDEFGFIPHIKTQYQASVLATSKVAKTAAKYGLPHSIMITTTAAFLNNESGIYAYNFFCDSLRFDEKFYDMSIEEIHKIMNNEAKRDFIAIEYPYWELGVEDTYFAEQCKALNYDQDAIDREVLNKWKSVSTTHPLGQEAIARLDDNKRKPNTILLINDLYRLKLYKDPNTLDWGIPYVIGGDCANNLGGDYSALVIIDPRDYSVVATLRSNSYSTMLYAKMIATLLTDYFYKAVLVLERNLNGATILDRIVEEDYSLLARVYAGPRNVAIGKLGIDTTENSRKLLYNQILRIAVNDSYDRIFDETIINEIKNLRRTRMGRIDHPDGGHDDCCISWLFTRWFLMYGENIERYMDPLIIGTFAGIRGKNSDETEKLRKKKENEIKEKIEREQNNMKAMFSRGSNVFSMSENGELPSLKEQTRLLNNGAFDNSKSGSELEDAFSSVSKALMERYNPEELSRNAMKQVIKDNEDGLADDGKIITLDPNEMESDDSLDAENMYNKNPKEIDFKDKAKEVSNDATFNRAIDNKVNSSSFNDDLNWFMGQMRGFRL